MLRRTKNLFKLIIPFLLLFLMLILPPPSGLSPHGHKMFAILIFAAFLFLLQPIPLGIAGLMVLIMPVFLGVNTPNVIFRSFGNSAVFFLIGAFIIATAIEKTGLHKRIALWYLKISSYSPHLFILFTMIAGASLSCIMPEHVVIVLIVPVLMYILVGIDVIPKKSNFAKAVMIGSAYGCSIGSLTTPLGGARNPLTIGFLNLQGINIDFIQWTILALPIVIVSIIITWLILILIFPTEITQMKDGLHIINEEIKKLPPLDAKAKRIIFVLMLCILLWIFLPQFTSINLAVISLLGGILMFIAGGIKWDEIESHIPWGIILLYGGSISLGIQLSETGAAGWLANQILTFTQGTILITIITTILVTKILTEFMSNTAAVSILLPFAYAIAIEIGIPPFLMCMVVGLSGGLAFMLLISTPGNLISYSSGFFQQRDLLKAGIIANITTIGIIILIIYTYWKWIGVW